MAFTDDDLKRLKDEVDKCLRTPTTKMIEVNHIAKPDYELAALLTRLEAAEKCAVALAEMKYQMEHMEHSTGLLVIAEAEDSLEAWHTASGKTSEGEGKE